MPSRLSEKIEPELHAPPPRKVRRRPPFAPKTEMVAAILPTIDKLRPFASAMFLIPILFGLYFLINLFRVLSAVVNGRSGAAPKPFVDALPLLIITVVWNFVAIPVTWNGFVKPLIFRWLVMYGQPAVGRITAVSLGPKTCLVSYIFYPERNFASIGSAEVTKDEWEETGGLNTEVTVLFSRRKPEWNIPYRFSGYEAVAA